MGRRHSRRPGQLRDAPALRQKETISRDDHGLSARLAQRLEGRRDFRFSRLDWIDEQRTNDRRRGRGAFHQQYGNGIGGKDEMRVESYQLFRERRQPCAVEVAKPISNLDILPFDVAQIGIPSRNGAILLACASFVVSTR
jgi:hypothetical protein